MRLYITAKPGSKSPGIEKEDPTHWIVRVREQPQEGKANKALLKAVAKELKLPVSHLRIIRGEGSRQKVIELPD